VEQARHLGRKDKSDGAIARVEQHETPDHGRGRVPPPAKQVGGAQVHEALGARCERCAPRPCLREIASQRPRGQPELEGLLGALGRRTGAAGETGSRSTGAGRAAAAVSGGTAALSAKATESTAGFKLFSARPAVESLLDPELNSHGAATAPSTTSVTTPAGSQ